MKNIDESAQPQSKLTATAKEILGILSSSTKPLSYEDMKTDISVDKATFYRNITKLQEENLVSSFESNDKKRYFEIKKTLHAHFVCTACNVIECLNILKDFTIANRSVENIIIKGKCGKCM
jgi:Fur family ferric uptake transcriptional regulator